MSRIIGNFRMVHSPESMRRDLEQHRAIFASEERCRHEVRMHGVPGVMKPCGKRAVAEVGGRWYCRAHVKKVQR